METDFSDYSQASTSGPDFSSSGSLSQGAIDSIGSDSNQNESFFGGSDSPNVMDFGRGSVSNITNASNYDPNFAGLGMIGRGLNPGFQTANQMTFDVPSYLQPQLEGKFGKFGPKYYSPVERYLQQDLPDIVKNVGIAPMLGKALDSITGAFNSAKEFAKDATGGFSLSDLTGAFSSQTGQEAVGQMADNVAFDEFGNQIDLTDTRQISNMSQTGADITTMPRSVASVTRDPILPDLRQQFTREGRIGGDIRSGLTYMGPGGDYTFSETMDQIKPAGRDAGAIRSPDVYSEGDFDIEDDLMQVADNTPFNLLQGLGSRFNPEINQFIKQNINPKLNFESGFRRDTDDPNKMMPYMGVNFPFNIG